MPAARIPFQLGDFYLTSSNMVNDNFLSYDQPPGPDRYRNKDNHGTLNVGHSRDTFLPSKRRSWIDVVDQCSEQTTERISTITDISSLADSNGAVQMDNQNASRRRSWEQFIEDSEDFAHLHQNLEPGHSDPKSNPGHLHFKSEPGHLHQKLDQGPLPTLPIPYANPALHLMTVRTDGRLARVHLYNKKRSIGDSNKTTPEFAMGLKHDVNRKESSSASSKTSTMSEFILVPSKTVLTPSSSMSHLSDDDSRRFRHDFGKSKKRSSFMNCPWTTTCRRTTFFMLLTTVLLLMSAIGGYVLRRYILNRRTIYDLTFPTYEQFGKTQNDGSSTTTLRLMVTEPWSAEFLIYGSSPYQNVRTVIDFDKKLLISRHLAALSNYCFISQLNESAIPNINALKEAAQNTLGKWRPVSWLENWHWHAQLVDENLRNNFYFDSESREQCANLYWLQKVDQNSSTSKCADCIEMCLPAYGIIRLEVDQYQPSLIPTGRDCFYLSTAVSPAPLSSVGRAFVNNPDGQPVMQDTRPIGPYFQRPQLNAPRIYQYQQQPYQNLYKPNGAWTNFASGQ